MDSRLCATKIVVIQIDDADVPTSFPWGVGSRVRPEVPLNSSAVGQFLTSLALASLLPTKRHQKKINIKIKCPKHYKDHLLLPLEDILA